ncbi:protein phosphatase 1B-like isoform X2 [Oscarella lobularis]|uniref:protein phosphatase 1B-like isoform X2 n=1 Tax=Oscarella lobularis TaxID=121494 RepID=UPI0033141972
MGAFLDKPNTEKFVQCGSSDDVRYGVVAMQGWRVEMEDAHTAVLSIKGHDKWSFFAIFDGHAGQKVAKHASEKLLPHITQRSEFQEAGTSSNRVDSLKEAIKDAFIALDEEIQKDFPEETSGTTAVGVLITETHVIFANCGDSRGLICRGGDVAFATKDHKPYEPLEKERIEKAGGNVVLQRVNGSLAVSRALGDLAYKRVEKLSLQEQLVSPMPDVVETERQEGDEFVVLACDGVWDVMKNEEVSAYVRRKMLTTDNLTQIGSDLVDTCLNKGSRDNMSVIIIAFKDAPAVSEDAIEKEKERNEEIEKKLSDKLQELVTENESEPLDDMYVMQQLTKDFPDEDIAAKKDYVLKALEKIKNRKYEAEVLSRKS